MTLLTLIDLCSQLKDTLLPARCLLCFLKAPQNALICNACQQELPILTNFCQRCAQNLPLTAISCGECIKSPPPFCATYALFRYEFPIVQMINQLKFQYKLIYATLLANFFIKQISIWYQGKSLPDRIIPVPLHVKRLKERGFNQAVEIAKPIARHFKITLDRKNITRHKNTMSQRLLKAPQRKSNIQSAFSTLSCFPQETVVILDDVMTTGATVRELSETLLRAGAKNVHIWCVARNQCGNN